MVSTFGKIDGTAASTSFFAADSQHAELRARSRTSSTARTTSPNFRAARLPGRPTRDILHRGGDAWNAALNTVNIGKYNLGWASIGICTHAFYEAITHAANRRLYGMTVTDFPHVKRLFTDAYARLVAMKLVALARLRLHALAPHAKTGATCSTTRS